VKRFANGNEFSVAMGGENIYMGLADYRIEGAPELSGTGFNNAYLALVPSASSFGVGRKFTNGIKVKFGLVNTHFAQTMLNQASPNSILQTSSSQQIAAVDMKTIEISKQFKNSILGFSFAGVGEQNMLLGTPLGNGFNLNKPAKTRVLTLNMAHKLSSNLVMAGYISHGITAGYDNPHSLVSAVSTTYSKAYGVGFSMNNVQRKADRFTVNLSSPLATTSGSMTLDLPSDVDINGNLVRTQRQISLASPAREYRTEITYFTPLSKTTALSINITHRQNANHMARETEQIAMMNYHISFD